jgi:hypothetical protein
MRETQATIAAYAREYSELRGALPFEIAVDLNATVAALLAAQVDLPGSLKASVIAADAAIIGCLLATQLETVVVLDMPAGTRELTVTELALYLQRDVAGILFPMRHRDDHQVARALPAIFSLLRAVSLGLGTPLDVALDARMAALRAPEQPSKTG